MHDGSPDIDPCDGEYECDVQSVHIGIGFLYTYCQSNQIYHFQWLQTTAVAAHCKCLPWFAILGSWWQHQSLLHMEKNNSARISRIQDSLHAHIVRSDRAGIGAVVVVAAKVGLNSSCVKPCESATADPKSFSTLCDDFQNCVFACSVANYAVHRDTLVEGMTLFAPRTAISVSGPQHHA